MIKWQSTVISQYNQSPTLQTLLYGINQWLDPTQNIDAFYKLIWNVDTAQGYGLDVWGRIVAVERTIANVQTGDLYWGFGEASTLSAKPFDTSKVKLPQGGGIFYNGELFTSNVDLHDSDFRTLILAKAAFNICNGSIPAINQILMMLFGKAPKRGNAYVVDNQNMSMTYTFEFQPTPVEVSIIQNTGVLPRPTGVQVLYRLNVPSGATRVFSAAAIIGGASADFFAGMTLGPSFIHGAGAVHATARVRFAPLARMGGVGHVSANTSVTLAQKQLSGARMAGAGSVHATARVPGRVVTNLESVHGAASLQASASIRRDIPGGVYFFSATGTIHANAIVVHRAAASARLAAVGGTEAHGMRVVDAASHIAGAGGTKSGLVEDLAGAARLVGLTHVDADAMRLAHGAARMPGVADMHAIGRRIVFGAGRIAGASNVRANGTVGNTGVWDLSSYDDGSVWG